MTVTSFTHSFCGCVVVLSVGGTLWAGGPIDVKVSKAMREYCHILEFPQGWNVPKGDYNGLYVHEADDYQFRIVGLLGTRFLVGGIVRQGHRIETIFATNKYQVDLSDPKAPVRPASNETWESGTVISLAQKSTFNLPGRAAQDRQAEIHGFHIRKKGELWALSPDRLSPDQAWIVLQSWSGPAGSGDGWDLHIDRGFFFGYRGKVFFDIFNVDSGKQVLSVQGNYSTSDPDGVFLKTGWVTERYFIVPMGEHLERCLVCEFGGRGRKQ